MTELTGAELDLAVARVMGAEQIAIGQPGIVMHINIDEWPPQAQGWRPSQGGAAAWDVLEWVRRRYEVIFADQDDDPRLVWCGISTDAHSLVCHVAGAYGPTDAIALCRAVVALGEAG